MLNRFFILSMAMTLLLSCGDDDSGKSPVQSEFGESSSGEVNSSSSDKVSELVEGESSSSSKKIALSSSTPRSDKKLSSSSSKEKKSSSSSKVETSSSKKSSSSSSNPRKDNKSSSSSVKNPEAGEGSSSSESSSSGIVTQNSSSSSENLGPIENTSSSEESSSSLNPVESSSSEMSSSSVSSSSALMSIYDAENNTLTDLRDGQVYKTVTIGLQVWMAENLNYLPKDTAGTFWAGRSVCGGGEHKSHQEGDCSVYGRLYERKINGYDGFNKNICPDGWDVPTSKQWQVLVEFLGGNNVAGKAMKSNENLYWPDEDLTNKFGFSALPAGYYDKYKGYNSRCDVDELRAVFTVHSFNSSERNGIWINDKSDVVTYTDFGEGFYLSIRCIKK